MSGAEQCASAKQKKQLSYVIGTEVPIPGGEVSEIKTIHVTKVKNIQNTIDTHLTAFKALGLDQAITRIIAIVVQPGVEFDHSKVIRFNRNKAVEIANFIEIPPGL